MDLLHYTVGQEEAVTFWPVRRGRSGGASPLLLSPADGPNCLPFLKEIIRRPEGFPLKT